MDPRSETVSRAVSNLVPGWGDAGSAAGGSFDPSAAADAVSHALRPPASDVPPRTLLAPERFDAAELAPRPSAFSYDLLHDEEHTWAEAHPSELTAEAAPPIVDYDALRRRDIARELLRARLVAIAERRERRSAYELVFLMLAASVAILLAAPPLVQVFLAMHGTQT